LLFPLFFENLELPHFIMPGAQFYNQHLFHDSALFSHNCLLFFFFFYLRISSFVWKMYGRNGMDLNRPFRNCGVHSYIIRAHVILWQNWVSEGEDSPIWGAKGKCNWGQTQGTCSISAAE
jgi:hypothetical protein